MYVLWIWQPYAGDVNDGDGHGAADGNGDAQEDEDDSYLSHWPWKVHHL